MKKVLVTGGSGFIGANFIRSLLERSGDITLFNLDKLTYAGDTERLKTLEDHKRYKFIKGDINDKRAVYVCRGLNKSFHSWLSKGYNIEAVIERINGTQDSPKLYALVKVTASL